MCQIAKQRSHSKHVMDVFLMLKSKIYNVVCHSSFSTKKHLEISFVFFFHYSNIQIELERIIQIAKQKSHFKTC